MKLCQLLVIIFFTACAVTIKNSVILPKYELKGSVSLMEESTANILEPILDEEIDWETIDFKPTHSLYFDSSGTIVEEIFYSKARDKEKKKIYKIFPKKKLQLIRVYDGNDKLVSFEKILLNESNKISRIEFYDINEDVYGDENEILAFLENYNNEDNLTDLTVFEFNPIFETTFHYKDPSKYKTVQHISKDSAKDSDIYYRYILDENSIALGSTQWEYQENFVRIDVFNKTEMVSRTEKTMDKHGNPILVVKYTPTFQTKTNKLDWTIIKSALEISPFRSENYGFKEIERVLFKYDYDKHSNWILRKKYTNDTLTEITERKIEYY